MNGAESYVLDSFALLAYLDGEPGAAEVEEILLAAQQGGPEAWLSVVNFGEVLYITERERGLRGAHQAIALIDGLPIRVAEADRPRTFAAAHVKAHHALSYADAFAVALALEIGGPVVTGDPAFGRVEGLITVRWLAGGRSR